MRIISVNVGLPREALAGGRAVLTGIFKSPAEGRVRVERLNLAGDRQADLSVHGGANKAVYSYPSEHYTYWEERLGRKDLAWGMFGENLTLEGVLEDQVHIGDRLRAGSALLCVTQPRIPCYKLGIKFGRPDIVKKFLLSGRSGFYCSVVEEGDVAAGDRVEIVGRDENLVSVADCVKVYNDRKNRHADLLRRILQVQALPNGIRNSLMNRLADQAPANEPNE